MPVYVYQHPKTGKRVEVVQHMNDLHEYTDPTGVSYERVFLNPRTAVDTQLSDPFSKGAWMRRTHKKMTLGDMMDESAQLSERRASKAGVDPIKQKLFDTYTKKTGKPHPEARPKRIETKDFVLEL